MANELPAIRVRVTADTSSLERGLSDSEKTIGSFKGKIGPAITATKALTATVIAAGGALTAMAVASANAEKEIEGLARLAGTSVSKFKSLSFAYSQVGISSEKLADISKDTNEKLGEFIATGGGGFKDFFDEVAPKVGITANELKYLSGPDVLQRVKNAMDQANVSLKEQSFFLESIASDTTLLIPLLADEGAELAKLTRRYEDAAGSIKLLESESKALSELSTDFDLVTESMTESATFISAQFAPILSDFFKFIAKDTPKVTNEIVSFFDAFRDPENQRSIKNLSASFIENARAIAVKNEQLEKLNRLEKGTKLGDIRIANTLKARDALVEENKALNERVMLLKKEQEITSKSASMPVPMPNISATFEQDEAGKGGEASSRFEMLRNSLLTERELLAVHFEENKAMLQQSHDDALITDSEFFDTESRLKAEHEASLTGIAKAEAKKREDVANKEKMARLAVAKDMLGNLSSLMSSENKKQFEIGKTASIAGAIVKGYESAVNSYEAGSDIGGPVLGAAFAATSLAATNAQIQGIRSQSFSRGGGGTGGAAVSAPAAPQAQQQGGNDVTNINVRGLNPNDLISGEQLVSILNQALGDGWSLE